MRHICNGLGKFLPSDIPHIVQDQRQYDGKRKTRNQGIYAQDQRVLQDAPEPWRAQELLEPAQAYPFASPEPILKFKIPERDLQSVHGPIAEKYDIDQ